MSIASNIEEVRTNIPVEVTLVAVSKTKPNSSIESAYTEKQRHFGENKVQELVGKYESLPKDIKWHMIGHLQRNKVKYIAPFVYLIHGVDSLKLLQEINKQGKKANRVISVLLQVHIAEEETKFGMDLIEIEEIAKNYVTFENVSINGFMGMATFTADLNKVESEFSKLHNVFQDYVKENLFGDSFNILSMGMSSDYKIAIKNGSNMVRVGSSIFGNRQ